MDTELNTVVSDSEIVLPTVTAPEVKVSRGRGRPVSDAVALRRSAARDATIEVLTENPSEALTVSQIVRKIEAKGLTTPTIWTDVYTFLNNGGHTFFASGAAGTRVKWTATWPTSPEALTQTETEVLPVTDEIPAV